MITITSIDELDRAVEWLEKQIETTGKTVVAIYAPMGAGKTTLIGRFAEKRQAKQQPSSPTFAIINTYDTPTGLIFHFDLYRIDTRREAEDLSLSDYFYEKNAICLVEWPEKIEEFLPDDITLRVKVEVTNQGERKLWVVE